MSSVVSFGIHSLAKKLFIDFPPGIFQSHGAVEYQMTGRRIFVYIEIADTLELQIGKYGQVGHVFFYVATGQSGQ